jgi:peptidoglycan hydrolase-like amidase
LRISERLLLLCFLLTILSVRPSLAQETPCRVGVLYSRATASYSPTAWLSDFRGALVTLEAMGIGFRLFNEEDLATGILDCSLIILPDLRCLSRDTSDRLAEFSRSGGRILALYQTSYRDQENLKVGPENNFQLAELFGCDFYRWVSGQQACDSLLPSDEFQALAPGIAVDNAIFLGRNRGMLVRLRKGAVPLAFWKEERSPAIVLNPQRNCIYAGENLFAPENSASPEVRLLIARLMDILLPGLLDPEAAVVNPPEYAVSLPPANPVAIPPGGAVLRILVARNLSETGVDTGDGLSRIRLQSRAGNTLEILEEDGRSWLSASGKTTFRARPGGAVGVFFYRPNGTYSVRLFRGAVEISAFGGSVSVINEISLEEYLAGVLPNEMLYTFPEESLKAMAMISRTFALSHRNRHLKENYNLCSSVHCQVYGGVLSEEMSTSRAVMATRGRRVMYHNRLAEVTFHSCCGGAGEAVRNVWGGDYLSYLGGYSDEEESGGVRLKLSRESDLREFIRNPPPCFCDSSGRFRWREEYTAGELEGLLRGSLPVLLGKPALNPGRLLAIRILERFPSGRVKTLLIECSGGAFRIYSDSIRWLFSGGKLGLGGLQSTLFYIDRSGGDGETRYVFHGGGWGHGAGLCQEGAAGMARKGFNAVQIIRHYFPGTEIVQ